MTGAAILCETVLSEYRMDSVLMRFRSTFVCHKGPEGNPPQPTFTRVLVSVMLFTLLVQVGCLNRADPVNRLNPELVHQIASLSVSGRNQASVILKRTGELRFTTDGGQTWQIIPSAEVGGAFESATMIENKRGWAVNRKGHAFTTDSAGARWTKMSELKDFTGANQIEFVNERDGWIREFLSIWRTRNGGATWRETLSTVTPGVYGQPSSMFLIDANTVVSSGSDGQIYLTKDGGETWRIQTPVPGKATFNDVWFVDQKRGWVTGYLVSVAGESLRPLLLETTDGGDSWKELLVESDVLASSVCFVGDEGWLAGSRRIVNGESVKLAGVLFRTKDAGKNWVPVQFGPEEPFFTDVRFTDPIHGWLVGRDSLYRSEDGGKSWRIAINLPPLKDK